MTHTYLKLNQKIIPLSQAKIAKMNYTIYFPQTNSLGTYLYEFFVSKGINLVEFSKHFCLWQ